MLNNAGSISRENLDTVMPPGFKNHFNQSLYDKLVAFTLEYFEKHKLTINGMVKGRLDAVMDDGTTIQFSMEMLTRQLAEIPVFKWRPAIFGFFNSCKTHSDAYRFFFKDYEHAAPHIKLLVKRSHFLEEDLQNELILTSHFPGTVSALVFHFKNQFRFLQKRDIREWSVSEEELFAQALHNISSEQVVSKVAALEEGVNISIMLSTQFAASRLIEIEKNEPQLIGKLGTIFAIPSNGASFCAPLNDRSKARTIFDSIMQMGIEAHKIEPNPITFDIFHYENGRFDSMMQQIKSEYPEIYKLLERKV